MHDVIIIFFFSFRSCRDATLLWHARECFRVLIGFKRLAWASCLVSCGSESTEKKKHLPTFKAGCSFRPPTGCFLHSSEPYLHVSLAIYKWLLLRLKRNNVGLINSSVRARSYQEGKTVGCLSSFGVLHGQNGRRAAAHHNSTGCLPHNFLSDAGGWFFQSRNFRHSARLPITQHSCGSSKRLIEFQFW